VREVGYREIVLKRWIGRAPVGTMRYWLTLVAVVSRCGAGSRMKVKMFFVGLLMPLRDKLLGPRETQLTIRHGNLEVPWTVGPKSDFDVLNEVLVLKVYGAAHPPTEPKTILDLGSHVGATVLFWRERFPGALIVAVEPDPVTFSRLRRNVGRWPGVDLRNVAVCMDDGPVAFFSANQSWVSSLSGEGERVTVVGRSFPSLVMEIGHVDLLKVDIEGAEQYILDDGALQNVDAIVGEYHNTGDAGERERFFARLREHFVLRVGQTAPFIAFYGARSPTGSC
jgi:FkbM family methyltransferase